jgi:hypothetical protein
MRRFCNPFVRAECTSQARPPRCVHVAESEDIYIGKVRGVGVAYPAFFAPIRHFSTQVLKGLRFRKIRLWWGRVSLHLVQLPWDWSGFVRCNLKIERTHYIQAHSARLWISKLRYLSVITLRQWLTCSFVSYLSMYLHGYTLWLVSGGIWWHHDSKNSEIRIQHTNLIRPRRTPHIFISPVDPYHRGQFIWPRFQRLAEIFSFSIHFAASRLHCKSTVNTQIHWATSFLPHLQICHHHDQVHGTRRW